MAVAAGLPFVQVAGLTYWNNALYVTDTGNTGTTDGPGAIYRINLPVPNNPPAAEAQSAFTTANTATAITLSATDADGDSLAYSIGAPPAHGQLTGTAPTLTYTPAANYAGLDSFTFTANDGTADSNTATISVMVKMNTTTAVTSSRNPSTHGQAVTFRATVSSRDGRWWHGRILRRNNIARNCSARRTDRIVDDRRRERRGALHNGRIQRQREFRRQHVAGAVPVGEQSLDHVHHDGFDDDEGIFGRGQLRGNDIGGVRRTGRRRG